MPRFTRFPKNRERERISSGMCNAKKTNTPVTAAYEPAAGKTFIEASQ